MKEKYKFIGIGAILVLVYLGLFYIHPSPVETLALIYEEITTEPWRYLSYQFVHLDATHLYENIISFVLIIILAIELKMDAKDTTTVYLLTGILAVLPLWIFLRSTLLGASAAIYGGYAMSSVEMKKLNISPLVPALLILIVAAYKPAIAFFAGGEVEGSIIQAALHLAGAIFGFLAYKLTQILKPIITRRKRRCLQTISE